MAAHVFYHSDADGICSAYLHSKMHGGEATYSPINYGARFAELVPASIKESGRGEIHFVDFSPPVHELLDFASKARDVQIRVTDHHKTAFDHYAASDHFIVERATGSSVTFRCDNAVVEIDVSAKGATGMLLNQSGLVSPLLDAVSHYDVGEFEHSENLMQYVELLHNVVDFNDPKGALEALSMLNSLPETTLLAFSRAPWARKLNDIEKMLALKHKLDIYRLRLDMIGLTIVPILPQCSVIGFNVPVRMATSLSRAYFLCNSEPRCICAYETSPKGVAMSFRSNNGSALEIAGSLGGGGHADAAGAFIDPFNLKYDGISAKLYVLPLIKPNSK